jgi:hypothetical protein
MSIAKEPFRLYNENQEEKPDIFTIRLNKEERLWLNKAKTYIQQPKDSSALKLLAEIGAEYVLHDPLAIVFLKAYYRNLTNNARLGVPVETPSFNTNVTGLEYQNQESK